MVPKKTGAKDGMLLLGNKITLRECQLELLEEISDNDRLLGSTILPSINPKLGKIFQYKDLEAKKNRILLDARASIIKSCSIVEAMRDINRNKARLDKLLSKDNDNRSLLEDQIKICQTKTKKEAKKRLDKKILFHSNQSNLNTKPSSKSNQKRKNNRTKNTTKKREQNKKYKQRKKLQKNEWMANKVAEIKSTTVRNLSSHDIPDCVYLYLAKGLGFVESRIANKEDLSFDAKEFLRKLEWKVFFHQHSDQNGTGNINSKDIHHELRIPSRSHPPDLANPLLDDIKAKILGFVSTFEPEKPKSNLTPAEQRGKAWLLKAVKSQQIFVTKADKGGAIILLDFKKALESLREEINNPEKFTKVDIPLKEKMQEVKKGVISQVILMESKNNISDKDRTIITGLTDKGGMKRSPVFRPVVPYPYPLYKLHKCTNEEIEAKKIPPLRLVHSTKHGPLYRLEKWCSPFLTSISKEYCKAEYLLDTPDLLNHIEMLNSSWPENDSSLLFTLDVVALYPSISIDVALEAMTHAFSLDNHHDSGTKEAVFTFSKYILNNSFVAFEDNVYEAKKGIPTGNCISRQVADMSMCWLLFESLKIDKWTHWDHVRFWKRYIDDIIGRWRGTVRQFHIFLRELNRMAAPFGIRFADAQIGKRVHYLDVVFYLDDNGQIQYRLYLKETDARQFLHTDSFHPECVFTSVPFSQMLRVINRNSKDETCVTDLQNLKEDLIKCGHSEDKLEQLEPKAVQRSIENKLSKNTERKNKENNDSLVFATKFFKEVGTLKKQIQKVDKDIKHLNGGTRVIVALKKHQSIKDNTVKNRRLSEGTVPIKLGPKRSQSCDTPRCELCPLLFDFDCPVIVNGQEVILNRFLNCKSDNIIYLAQCQICARGRTNVLNEDSYFGQTINEGHIRFNDHRSKFKIDEDKTYKKSALSEHCFNNHPDQMELSVFKVGIVKKCRAIDLDREEDRFISKFRTNIFGLNRMNVSR